MMEKHGSSVHPASIHPFLGGSNVEQVKNRLRAKRLSITISLIASSGGSRPCRVGSGISQGHQRNMPVGKRRATT